MQPSSLFLQNCHKLKNIVVLMEEPFYLNHPLSCSGGTGGTVPPSANFDENLPPLATGIPKLQNNVFKIKCT